LFGVTRYLLSPMRSLLLLVVVSLVHLVVARVAFNNGKFYEGSDQIIVKGVGYAPAPIGADPTVSPPYGDYYTQMYSAIYKRDLAILRPMGVNTLRLWGWGNGANHTDFLNVAYNDGVNPIYIAAEFWMGPGTYANLADPATIKQLLADFQTFLNSVNNHPAILFYILGSDLNAGWNYAGQLDALFSVLSQLTELAHTSNMNNLVTSALNDENSAAIITTYDTTTSLDFWSLNLYRGCTFGTLFTQFPTISKKGLFISEYGIDSFNDQTVNYDQALQANCVIALSKEILANNATAIGGAVVEYVDEYWKGKLGVVDARHPGCPNYNAAVHSICGNPNPSFPDGYVNQAWFGIVNASFAPRAVYAALTTLWTST